LAEQHNADGSFGSDRLLSGNVAVCALAGLAFLSEGSTTDRGDYAEHIRRCIGYIESHADPSGLLDNPDYQSSGPMYGHGFGTLFLAEVYGMPDTDHLKSILENAISLIVRSQNDEGGWRYQPVRKDADLSVTVCQMMALRAVRNAGFHVPADTVDRCIDYVRRSQNPDGGFAYQLEGSRESGFARTAAAIVTLNSAGVYEGDQLQRGLTWMITARPSPDDLDASYYYYGHYYAAQALWQVGDEPFRRWYPSVSDELTKLQTRAGSWPSRYSPEYSTAMALIVLQIPNNLVPIFQR
ncbi:MAG: prenyltransferase/squalene oxidase repeat-containing protein, partial [Pirellulaceae bacterium]